MADGLRVGHVWSKQYTSKITIPTITKNQKKLCSTVVRHFTYTSYGSGSHVWMACVGMPYVQKKIVWIIFNYSMFAIKVSQMRII